MSTYVLMLACQTAGDPQDSEGAFDTVTWVSPDGGTPVDPDTDRLALNPGDSVAFAAVITDQNGAPQTGFLQWMTVVMNSCTNNDDRADRLASNNSPFRQSATSTRPLNLLLSNVADAGNTWGFTQYDASGNQVTSGGVAIGIPPIPVVTDIPPGGTTPVFPTSKYESTIVVSLNDGTNMWQFSYDPEMDVDNAGGG